MEFITFQGKEYVQLQWANMKHEEWVERSEYIQERSSERKHHKSEVLTSTIMGELLANQSERKENVHIVLPDKQEANLKDIYHWMPKEADQIIAQGFHNEHLMLCSEKSVSHDLWIFG